MTSRAGMHELSASCDRDMSECGRPIAGSGMPPNKPLERTRA
jgi:hypothetical protein